MESSHFRLKLGRFAKKEFLLLGPRGAIFRPDHRDAAVPARDGGGQSSHLDRDPGAKKSGGKEIPR